ncbi:MAG: TIGR01244 family phosphatase [Alphaproteobacteria bacterium]|nr:MAG: TIGR01244 family phosphatase [Alphaproteobacteria bacterium]
MTDFRKVTDQVSVAPQIGKTDIDAAADAGVELIINNRPDGEEMGQPEGDELATYAATRGIKWASIPVVGGQLTFEAIESMAYALKSTEGPILAYCRSGTRSCTLWGLATAMDKGMETTDIVAAAAEAGYDLSGMAPTMDHLRAMERQ